MNNIFQTIFGIARKVQIIEIDEGDGKRRVIFELHNETGMTATGEIVEVSKNVQRPLDCGHFPSHEVPGGKCTKCGGIVCHNCIRQCSNCGRTLCLHHTLEYDQKNFCEECYNKYRLGALGSFLFKCAMSLVADEKPNENANKQLPGGNHPIQKRPHR